MVRWFGSRVPGVVLPCALAMLALGCEGPIGSDGTGDAGGDSSGEDGGQAGVVDGGHGGTDGGEAGVEDGGNGDAGTNGNDGCGDDFELGDFEVGEEGPAGGLVFYVDEEKEHTWIYLEAAPEVTEWANRPWGGFGIEVGAEAQGTDVGDGSDNTEAIVEAFGEEDPYYDDYDEPHWDADEYAAKLAADLKYDGCDDWFLPSWDELVLMDENLHQQDLGGFAGEYYLSSSEAESHGSLNHSEELARARDFSNGDLRSGPKELADPSLRFRAVRAFGTTEEEGNDGDVEAVGVIPKELWILPGETGQLEAEIEPADATEQGVTWQSSHPEVATVDEDGVVTVPQEAEAFATATVTVVTVDGEHTDSAEVKVAPGIGDEGPAGGHVFYFDEDNEHEWAYLEAAPNHTAWDNKPWGGFGTEVGVQSRSIGDGAVNTKEIVSAFGENEPNNERDDYAAKLAQDLQVSHDGETYDDWFLPSSDELEQIRDNLTGEAGLDEGHVYWSSSEAPSSSDVRAWIYDLDDFDIIRLEDKDSAFRVRAVRAFGD